MDYIPINNLKRQYERIKPSIDQVVSRVLESGWYILGPEVEAFENEFANYCGTNYCIGVANGTDAIEIGLKSLGITAGDEVITVANAGFYSTNAILAIGAIPVFVDIEPNTMTMDISSLSSVITPRTQAVIVTHLFGRMTDMIGIEKIKQHHKIALLEDCSQAHGAHIDGKRAGSWGDIGCFSFYPTKNLGAMGDGGAIVTSDARTSERARMFRQYGWSSKYQVEIQGGRNSRLDEIQAAILRVKLPYLNSWNNKRLKIAEYYCTEFDEKFLRLPPRGKTGEMVYHLFVIRVSGRDILKTELEKSGIGCDIHYPIPDHLQPACAKFGFKKGLLPETEQATSEVITLPCFPELSNEEIDRVVQRVIKIQNERFVTG
jgi:dTDP-3-amino-2,3,6-trideoxy-4-keto-D-glucose/dTDP-3-amino-3,4,6-trideoxy-alpha-D-glucose/dTDP-2,6-dideoxy-D-kanosamine transaminase